ncbi:hypothetical protein BY996DRAFT_4572966 [Phakopsora pachyrhizi]|uniref:S-methyl-5-thioribose-1-phosphate isomerase n=1 Tax=Phakopsora pachyrhizi TaxID=170000 RepID=A0AAV0BK29_PHAPC|nr:hypothetical protein BY996DRAFT_4572966 [Phakopsora pachyrhizi]CAH7687020.1 hypothetical protein PPACK8108_LOCUS21741 [Phakopsora pachyrhizi]
MSISLSAIRLINGEPLEVAKAVEIINQLKLPHQFEWVRVESPEDAFEAIRSMWIRGAPAIGSLAALSLGLGILRGEFNSTEDLRDYLEDRSNRLVSARPTAVNLKEAIQRVRDRLDQLTLQDGISLDGVIKGLLVTCKSVWEEDLARNRTIGSNGVKWILNQSEQSEQQNQKKFSVLTVCNTGSLATSGYGTALGVITALHEIGRLEHVYYMQTGPYMQGARLTSLELESLSINSTMVCDTAAAYIIRSGLVDVFIAGADRIASNGDTANKISTYQIALLCKHALPKNHKRIPVMIAAPLTTFDLGIKDGDQIEIEQRPSIEAITVRGKILNNKQKGEVSREEEVVTVLITPQESTKALNPAFDVTPASLIDGIVTELGVMEKKEGSVEGNGFFDISGYLREHRHQKSDDQESINLQINKLTHKYQATSEAYERNTGHSLSSHHQSSGQDQQASDDQNSINQHLNRVLHKHQANAEAYKSNTGQSLSNPSTYEPIGNRTV